MANCNFDLKVRQIQEDSNRSFTLDTDRCDVESHRVIEVPLRGPDPATTLAIVSGIAVAHVDIFNPSPPSQELGFELFILTDYKLDAREQFVDGTVYAWLSAITDDDHNHRTASRIEEVNVQANVDGRIQVHVIADIQGDMLLARVGYQAFVLSSKPRPLVVPTPPITHGSRHIVIDAEVHHYFRSG